MLTINENYKAIVSAAAFKLPKPGKECFSLVTAHLECPDWGGGSQATVSHCYSYVDGHNDGTSLWRPI